MKLEFTISASKLNAVLKAVLAVTIDCLMSFDKDGIRIRMIDPSNAAMIDLNMPSGIAFETFDAEEGDIAVDARQVLEKTTTFDNDTVLTVSFDAHTKKIKVVGDGARYGISTMPTTSVRKVPTIPDLDLPLEVEMDASRFKQMIKRAGLVSDHILVGYTDADAFFVAAEGDTDNFQQNTVDQPCKMIYKTVLETLYSLEMIDPMAKIATGPVNIRLGGNLPLTMSFVLEDVDIMYLLAPRIEKTAEDE